MDGEEADEGTEGRYVGVILTPDQRVRVFVSSTMEELAAERTAVRDAVDGMRLSPVLFELGARAHPPRSLYRSYLEQSHVFVGIYWERYGWIAPTMEVSGLEDEYLMAGTKPKLMYVKRPAPGREPRLDDLLDRIRSDDAVAYKSFDDATELAQLVADDLSLLLSEAFLDVEPARPTPSTRRFTLPGEATTFIGRAEELDRLRPMLEGPDVRMVTLTGPGGIGKTRLALRLAAQLAGGFEEGAAFVSLDSIADDALVVDAIARAVGLRDSSGVTVETLADDLANRSLLLVLDNFEHVMGAADVVAELLRNAPHLKVVATSREALRIQAEHEYPVPPLADPDSVRMFVDRALAIRPDLRLDESSGGTIDRIGRRLDGVPLAIELAAARVKLLSPAALLDRLDRRLEFLVGGPRDLPERQRALRSTIEWSYDLLEEADREVFDRLGVFVGSFGLTAAEAILDPGSDAIDALASLVDKSLLRVEPTSDEPRGFRMLSMIAEFARDRLARTDDAERIGSLHATHYRDVAIAVGEGVVGRDQKHWLAVLGDDHDGEAGNVRAALAWLIAAGRLDDVADMAWVLWVPAWINGRIDEGRRMAQGALEAGGELSDRSRARLETVLGMFEMWGGGHGAAAAALERGRQLAEQIGDDAAVASATLGESMIVGPSEGEDRSEELARDTLDRFTSLGDVWGEAAALNVLGWLYVAQERFDDADVFERTLSTSIAAGDEQFSALAEVNLAEYALHHGDVARAGTLLASCVERHRAVRLPYSVAYLLDGAARLAASTDDLDRAARLLAAATGLRTSAGVSVWGSQLVRRDRFVEEVRTSLGDPAYTTAVEAGSALCYSDAVAEVPASG